jgi:hypothetical protein
MSGSSELSGKRQNQVGFSAEMGAEREDTDPSPKRTGTEPGLGKSSMTKAVAAPPPAPVSVPVIEEEAPPPVDFDALHAALGDPIDYEELEPEPHGASPAPNAPPVPKPPPTPTPRGSAKVVPSGDSSGRSSATYASARPHTIPPTRNPTEDLNAPAVIVASDDTVPSAPPKMTVPMSPPPHMAPYGGVPQSGSNPQLAPPGHHPSSGSLPHASAVPAHARTPQPFVPQRPGQMTVRMPDRPMNPRRAKTPTIVVRARGPSTKQKLIAFMAAFLVVTSFGIAGVLIFSAKQPRPDGASMSSASAAPAASSTASGAMPAPSGANTPVLALPSTAVVAPAVSASAPPVASAAKPKPKSPAPTPAPPAPQPGATNPNAHP